MLLDSTFWDRLFFLLIGIAIGLMLGWASRAYKDAREAKEEAHEAHEEVIRLEQEVKDMRNEDGITRYDIALFIVVALSVVASILSQSAANKSQVAIDKLEDQTLLTQITQYCTESFFTITLTNFNARSDLTSEQVEANIRLQKAQANLITKGLSGEISGDGPLKHYLKKLTEFVNAAFESREKSQDFPTPEASAYNDCLDRAELP